MLVMMTVDRFQAICYPLTNQGWLHEHSLKVSYLGIWLGKVGVSNARHLAAALSDPWGSHLEFSFLLIKLA